MVSAHALSLLLFSGGALSQLQCDTFEYQHQLYDEAAPADIESSTLEACCDGCVADVDCVSYTFGSVSSACYFFDTMLDLDVAAENVEFTSGSSSNDSAVPAPDMISETDAPVDEEFFCDIWEVNHPSFGVDEPLGELENATLEACCQRCLEIADCWSYTMNVEDMHCTLFNPPLNLTIPTATASTQYISGSFNNITILPISETDPPVDEEFFCDIWEVNHPSFGVDEPLGELEDSNLEECCQECLEIPDCWSYTMNLADMHCTLFNPPLNLSMPTATASTQYISGSFNNITILPDPRGFIEDDIVCGTTVSGNTEDANAIVVEFEGSNGSPGVFRFFEVAEVTQYMLDTCQGGSLYTADFELFGPTAQRNDSLEDILSTRITDGQQIFVTTEETGYMARCTKAMGLLDPGTYWFLVAGRTESDSGFYEIVPICNDPITNVEGGESSGSSTLLAGHWCLGVSLLLAAVHAQAS